ncbi:uncharacterized protein V1516DRAFT_674284 [Lipomyces oligophaga]|uniref:uncharacterized protein n=1 Tax=Lipomyces oligophaga TaxID=45792 RepID=UPI0034CE1FCE
MSIELDYFEVILTEADKEALNGEDVNILNIPKDWPELSEASSKFHSWMSDTRNKQYLDCVATRQSIFDDPVKSEALGLNSLYNELPPFDVQARWSLREEHLLMRKIYFQTFLVCFLIIFSFGSDSDRLPSLALPYLYTDLDIPHKSGNVILSITSVFSYMGLILSIFLSVKFAPRKLASAFLLVGGLALIAQYWITNITGLYGTQAIIALVSNLFIFSIPGLRPFFAFQDLKLIAFLYLPTSVLFDLVHNLIGYSVISLGKAGDSARWRHVSLVYGILSCFSAICLHYVFLPSPLKDSSYEILQKRFTSRELTIMVNRVLRDNPFYDNSQCRSIEPKFMKTAKQMLFSLHALSSLSVGFVLSIVSVMLTETLREHILKQDRSSANLSLNS